MGLFDKLLGQKNDEAFLQTEAAAQEKNEPIESEDKVIAYHRNYKTDGEDFVSGSFMNHWGFILRRERFDAEGKENPSAPWVLRKFEIVSGAIEGQGVLSGEEVIRYGPMEWHKPAGSFSDRLYKGEGIRFHEGGISQEFTLEQTQNLIEAISEMAYLDHQANVSENKSASRKPGEGLRLMTVTGRVLDSVTSRDVSGELVLNNTPPYNHGQAMDGDEIDLVDFLLQDKREREAKIKENEEKIKEEARRKLISRELYEASKERLQDIKSRNDESVDSVPCNPADVQKETTTEDVNKIALQQQRINSLIPDK